MRNCPHCGLGVVEEDAVCPYCGHDMPPVFVPSAPVVESSTPLVAPPAPVVVPSAPAVAPVAPAKSDAQPPASDRQDPQPPVAVAATSSNRGLIAVAAVAAVVIGAVVLMQLFRGSDARQEPSPAAAPAALTGGGAAPRPSVSTVPRSAPEASAAAAQPRWTRSDSRIVEYKLPAEHEVSVWMTRVRPTLVVRCVSRETDVLVLMHSAASFEPQAGKHTVGIGFDAGAESKEQWLESDDSQALFAPDGVALARRIAASRVMRFGFTPHNAPPVVVDFDVRGFDALIGSVAKACRWKP